MTRPCFEFTAVPEAPPWALGAPVFAVVDAARDDAVLPFLRGSGRRFECLFDGWARTLYGNAAPYLVDLRGSALVRRRFAEVSRGQRWGVVLASSVGFSATRRQLRRNVMARVEGVGPSMLRFWDPWVFAALVASMDDEERDGLLGPIEAVVYERPPPSRAPGLGCVRRVRVAPEVAP